jgi:hypothetical protein
MQRHLQVYFDSRCITSRTTQELVNSVRTRPSGYSIEIEEVDLNHARVQLPVGLIAVPAYILDGEVIFLGNPTLSQLLGQLESQISKTGKVSRHAS